MSLIVNSFKSMELVFYFTILCFRMVLANLLKVDLNQDNIYTDLWHEMSISE